MKTSRFLVPALPMVLLLNLAARNTQSSPVAGNSSNQQVLQVGGARLQIDITGATPDLPISAIVEHVHRAAQAVSTYYGRFPVPAAHIIIPVYPDRAGILQGTTWGGVGGFPATTRLRIGQHTTSDDLDEDWVMTHELVHTALASLPDENHWLEEGIATYVEPIARVQAGQLPPEKIWADMVVGMPKGEPDPGDRGLDRTHTWGRTYWGGALFCFVADVEIRKQTHNTRGLQDALRGIVEAGGTIDKDWPIARVLRAGDQATGTSVLEKMYASWSNAPVTINLPDLWKQLGVEVTNGKVRFNDAAPLAQIRVAITTHQSQRQ